MKKVAIITPIPDMVNTIIQQSMLRKAKTEGVIDFDVVDLRDFGQGNYRQIDDTPYGGGGGMVLLEGNYQQHSEILDRHHQIHQIHNHIREVVV